MSEIIHKQKTEIRPYFIIVPIAILLTGVTYAFTANGKTPMQMCQENYIKALNEAKKERQETAERCAYEYKTDIDGLNKCTSNPMPLPENKCGNSLNATGSTTVPVAGGQKIIEWRVDFEAENGVREKTTGVEYHFTDENYDKQITNEAKLLAIWNAHTSKNGRVRGNGIAYHYVIMKDGTIYKTRNRDYKTYADAGYEKSKDSDENIEHVHIAFIGDDKPTDEQTKSMIWLGQKLLNDYGLPRDSITSHAENAPKDYKENIKYWYGSRENFLKNFTNGEDKTIKVNRQGVYNAQATYAWNTYKDMDFMLTIDAESGWKSDQVGDHGHAYGLCQFNDNWHKDKIEKYKTLSPNGQVDYCHTYYAGAKKDGNLPQMLHGYNVRMNRKDNLTFINP